MADDTRSSASELMNNWEKAYSTGARAAFGRWLIVNDGLLCPEMADYFISKDALWDEGWITQIASKRWSEQDPSFLAEFAQALEFARSEFTQVGK